MYPPASPGGRAQNANVNNPSAWTTGLCACGEDFSTCCLTYFCPCITFGRIAEILDNGSTSCGVSGVLYYLLMLVGCNPCYSCFYRKKLRAKFNLEEDPCGDCLVHCFCESCALCQEYKELKNKGLDPALGWAVNMERMRATHGGMVMTAPPTHQGMWKWLPTSLFHGRYKSVRDLKWQFVLKFPLIRIIFRQFPSYLDHK